MVSSSAAYRPVRAKAVYIDGYNPGVDATVGLEWHPKEAVYEGKSCDRKSYSPLSWSPRLHGSQVEFTITISCQSIFHIVLQKMLALYNYVNVKTYMKAPVKILGTWPLKSF